MAKKTNEVEIKVTADTRQASSALDSFKNKFKGLADVMAGVQFFKTVADGVLSVVSAVGQFAKEADEFAKIKQAFSGMTSSMGRDTDALIAKLEEATDGTVSQLNLIKTANEAMLKGIKPEDLEQIFAAADAAADSTGQSFEQMASSIAQGIASQREGALRTAGVLVDSQKAYQDYAASIGTTADQLSDAGKQQAFYKAAMDATKTTLERLSAATSDGSDKMFRFSDLMDRWAAKSQNFKNSVGTALLPAMTVLGNTFDQFMTRMSGGAKGQGEAVTQIEKFATALGKWLNFALQQAYAFGAGMKEFQTGLVKIWTSIGEAFVALGKGFVGVVKGDWETVKAAGNDLLKSQASLGDAFIQMTAGAFKAWNREIDDSVKTLERYEKRIADAKRKISEPVAGPGGTTTPTPQTSGGGGSTKKEEREFGLSDGIQMFTAAASLYTSFIELHNQKFQNQIEQANLFMDVMQSRMQTQLQDEITAEAKKFDEMIENQRRYHSTRLEEINAQYELENGLAQESLDAGRMTAEQHAGALRDIKRKADADKKKADEENKAREEQLEADKAKRLEAMEKAKIQKEGEFRRQRAGITFVAAVASMEMQKRLQVAQALAGGAAGMAQAYAGSMTLGPIAGPIVGATLASLVAAQTANSIAIIRAQQVLPPAELFLAEGGVVMPKPGGVKATIAEAGVPEAVIPLDRMGQMGGVTINFNGPVYGDKTAVARELVEAMDIELWKRHKTRSSVFGAELTA